MMKPMIPMIAICVCVGLSACGGESDGDSGPTPAAARDDGAGRAAASAAAASTFRATLSGAVDRTVEGDGVLSGARYGRYHLNMTSKEAEGGQPAVVIAFGRTDTETPSSGTYALGGREGEFGGTVEIYGDPQREFEISSGELVITDVRGDSLTGRFVFTALERLDEYTDSPPELHAEGTFESRAAR